MRRQYLGDRRRVNAAYPVNPPYTFVHIGFSDEKSEFLYSVLEPGLQPEEREKSERYGKRWKPSCPRRSCLSLRPPRHWRGPRTPKVPRQRFLTVLDLYDIEVPLKRRPGAPVLPPAESSWASVAPTLSFGTRFWRTSVVWDPGTCHLHLPRVLGSLTDQYRLRR